MTDQKKYYISFKGYKSTMEISKADYNKALRNIHDDLKVIEVEFLGTPERLYSIPLKKINFLASEKVKTEQLSAR